MCPAILDGETAETIYQAIHERHPLELFGILVSLESRVYSVQNP